MVEISSASLQMPIRVLLEMHAEKDACDAIVEMEDGAMYTALFATMGYFKRQMAICYDVTRQLDDTPNVCYTAIDTPHILVENLARDTIEDTIDNLFALDIFEGLFTRVTEEETESARTTGDGKLTTQEVAAVVISDVLVIDD